MKDLSPTSRKAVIATMVISVVLLFGSMTPPLLHYIFASYEGENAMMLLQIPAFVGMIVSFVVGPLALKVNLKYLMVIAALAALTYFMIFLFIGSNGPFIVLVIAAGIVGITQGAAMVLTASIFGAYVANPEKRANFVAISGALLNGGGALVNIIGGMLAAGNGGADWPNAYWLGLLIIPALIIFWIMMPKAPDAVEAPKPGEGPAGGAPAPKGGIPIKAILIVVMNMFMFLGLAVFLLNVGTYIVGELTHLGATSAESGLANSLFTILGVVAGFSFPLLVRFMKRFTATVGYALVACGMVCLVVFDQSIIGIFIGASLCGFGFNFAMPYLMGQLMAITPPHLIPVILSFNMGGMNLAMTFAPNIMGFVSMPLGGTIGSQLIIAAGIAGVCTIVSLFLFVFVKKTPAPQAE